MPIDPLQQSGLFERRFQMGQRFTIDSSGVVSMAVVNTVGSHPGIAGNTGDPAHEMLLV